MLMSFLMQRLRFFLGLVRVPVDLEERQRYVFILRMEEKALTTQVMK